MRTGKEEDWEKGGFSEAILKLSIPDKKYLPFWYGKSRSRML